MRSQKDWSMFEDFTKQCKIFLQEEKILLSGNKKSIFGNFSVKTNEDSTFKVTIFNKHGVLNVIKEHIDEFAVLPFYKDVLDLLLESKNIKNLNKVINICYFELVLFSIMPENKRLAFSKLPLVKAVSNKKFNRAKLFEVNKSAIVFDKTTRDKSCRKALEKGFDFIEIPKGFSLSKLSKLTTEISSLASEKGIKDFNLSLRIKKLGLYQTKGFYSKETNTMFLDPRHLDVWRHELAHYFVAKNDINTEDEEEFADNF